MERFDRPEGTTASPEERRTALRLAFRRRAGRIFHERITTAFPALPEEMWRLLTPEETDQHRDRMTGAVVRAREGFHSTKYRDLELQDFRDTAARFVERHPAGGDLFVAPTTADESGLLVIRQELLKKYMFHLLEFDRDSLSIADVDLNWGMVMQIIELYDVVTFELETWEAVNIQP